MRIKVFLTSTIFTCVLATYPAYAGGSDGALPSDNQEPKTENMINPDAPTSQNSPSQQPAVFDWKQWSKPYKVKNLICREHHGNVVCLTPSAAKRVNWQTR
jgi:hypothetical protein